MIQMTKQEKEQIYQFYYNEYAKALENTPLTLDDRYFAQDIILDMRRDFPFLKNEIPPCNELEEKMQSLFDTLNLIAKPIQCPTYPIRKKR